MTIRCEDFPNCTHDDHWVTCNQPQCLVRVHKPDLPAEPICFDHKSQFAARVEQAAEGPEKDAAIADYRRRVLGLDA